MAGMQSVELVSTAPSSPLAQIIPSLSSSRHFTWVPICTSVSKLTPVVNLSSCQLKVREDSPRVRSIQRWDTSETGQSSSSRTLVVSPPPVGVYHDVHGPCSYCFHAPCDACGRQASPVVVHQGQTELVWVENAAWCRGRRLLRGLQSRGPHDVPRLRGRDHPRPPAHRHHHRQGSSRPAFPRLTERTFGE